MNHLETHLEDARLQSEAYEIWNELFNHITCLAYFNHAKLHQESLNYLRYGSAKRINIIWDDVRWITLNIPVKRKTPLSGKELQEASLHLNSLYLHIRGCLDNFAWALIWQLAPNEAEVFNNGEDFQRIGLFRKSVLGKLSGTRLKSVLEECATWDKDLKTKRDPVAHRLPLFIPPQILTSNSQNEEYQELNRKISENTDDFAKKALEESKGPIGDSADEMIEKNKRVDKLVKAHEKTQARLYQQLESLGTFVPCFGYSKTEALIPLYPTITEDCKQLVKIANEVTAFFIERLSQ